MELRRGAPAGNQCWWRCPLLGAECRETLAFTTRLSFSASEKVQPQYTVRGREERHKAAEKRKRNGTMGSAIGFRIPHFKSHLHLLLEVRL